MAFSMPYLRLRCISSWKGFISPVSGSTATHSASMIASFALTCFLINALPSGYWSVMSSSRREKRMTRSSFLWACILSPSYLYSAMHFPPSFSRISVGEPNRSANIGRIGFPSETLNLLILSIPSSATVFATLPKSDEILYERSKCSRVSFPPPKAIAKASRTVMSAIPNLKLPVTVRIIYFASLGEASDRRPAKKLILRSTEPAPVDFAILSKIS